MHPGMPRSPCSRCTDHQAANDSGVTRCPRVSGFAVFVSLQITSCGGATAWSTAHRSGARVSTTQTQAIQSDDPTADLVAARRAVAALNAVPHLGASDAVSVAAAAGSPASTADEAMAFFGPWRDIPVRPLRTVLESASRKASLGHDEHPEPTPNDFPLDFSHIVSVQRKIGAGGALDPGAHGRTWAALEATDVADKGAREAVNDRLKVASWDMDEDEDWSTPKRTLWHYRQSDVADLDLTADMSCANETTKPELNDAFPLNISSDDAPRFFMDTAEMGVNFTDRINCLINVLAKENTSDLSQLLADFRMLKLFRAHPQRVYDRKKADFVVVDAPIVTSYFVAQRVPSQCGGLKEHEDLVAGIVEKLQEVYGERNTSKRSSRFLFVSTDERWYEAYGKPLLDFIRRSSSLVATPRRLLSAAAAKLPKENVMAIPFRINVGLEGVAQSIMDKSLSVKEMLSNSAHVWDITEVLERRHYTRINPFFFPGGDVEPTEKWKPLLRRIREMRSNFVDGPFGVAGKSFETFIDHLAHTKFCVIVPDDAGGMHNYEHLFPALASGCLPIVFLDWSTARQSLPFTHVLDWRSMAIFAGSVDCALENFESTGRWLTSLLYPEGQLAAGVEVLRDHGRSVFLETLSVNDEEFVTMLLKELSAVGLQSPSV